MKMTVPFLKTAVVSVLMALTAAAGLAVEGDPLGYTLLIQHSPPGAGTVTPGDGVHKIEIGQTVDLSALPRQGFRFLYWLGDVASTSEASTSVSVDSPKMVIAVFERAAFKEDEDIPAGGAGQSRGISGLFATPNPITAPGAVNPASYNGGTPANYPYVFDGGGEDGGGGENPAVPEPATLALLGLGAVTLLHKRRHPLRD